MNKRDRVILLVFSLLFFQGCSNTLYKGEIDALNSDDQEKKVIFYWTKTEPFIGKDKAGPAILMTECSTRRLTFLEQQDGIYFLGTPDLDKREDQTPLTTQNIPCGKIANEMKFVDVPAGPVNVDILCLANISEFTAPTGLFSPAYIKARKEPYTFEVTESSNWSFFGEMPVPPDPPECRQ